MRWYEREEIQRKALLDPEHMWGLSPVCFPFIYVQPNAFSGGKLIYMFHICILLLIDIFSCVICNQMDIEDLHHTYIYFICLNVYSYVLGSDLSFLHWCPQTLQEYIYDAWCFFNEWSLRPCRVSNVLRIGHILYQFYTLSCVIWCRIYQKISFHRYI